MEDTPQQKRSNQYIKRAERYRDIEFARRKIKAGILISRLNKAAAGKTELTKSQLEATKMLLDKAVPSLQAIEQTNIDPMDEMSEDQHLSQAMALITSNPALVIEAMQSDAGLDAAVRAHISSKPTLVVHKQDTQAA